MSDLFDDFNKIFTKDLGPIFSKYLKDPNNKIIDNLDLRSKGFQIKTHKGKDGGQEVFHFHLHILSNN